MIDARRTLASALEEVGVGAESDAASLLASREAEMASREAEMASREAEMAAEMQSLRESLELSDRELRTARSQATGREAGSREQGAEATGREAGSREQGAEADRREGAADEPAGGREGSVRRSRSPTREELQSQLVQTKVRQVRK